MDPDRQKKPLKYDRGQRCWQAPVGLALVIALTVIFYLIHQWTGARQIPACESAKVCFTLIDRNAHAHPADTATR